MSALMFGAISRLASNNMINCLLDFLDIYMHKSLMLYKDGLLSGLDEYLVLEFNELIKNIHDLLSKRI